MNEYDVTQYVKEIITQLSHNYPDNIACQQYAWWMLEALCNKSQAELIAHETIMLSPEQQRTLHTWLDQMINTNKPLQYILGSVPFVDCDILVEPPLLIPRPETEEWCYYLIEHLEQLDNHRFMILDLATGSGCIAVALAQHFPQARVVATDICQQALDLTEKNAEHNSLYNVSTIFSDMFVSIPADVQFDLIVSNPPYIAAQEWNSLEKTVTEWEDYNALVAPDDGLALIKQIIQQAPSCIKPNVEMKEKNIPQLWIEIGYNQGYAVEKYAQSLGYTITTIHKDLEKKDRLFMARVDGVANTCSRK